MKCDRRVTLSNHTELLTFWEIPAVSSQVKNDVRLNNNLLWIGFCGDTEPSQWVIILRREIYWFSQGLRYAIIYKKYLPRVTTTDEDKSVSAVKVTNTTKLFTSKQNQTTRSILECTKNIGIKEARCSCRTICSSQKAEPDSSPHSFIPQLLPCMLQ